jgi:hypothetical protein
MKTCAAAAWAAEKPLTIETVAGIAMHSAESLCSLVVY